MAEGDMLLLVVNGNGDKSKGKGDIAHYRLQGFTSSLRNSISWVAAREGSNALPINILTVTQGFELVPIITRSLEAPHHKKGPPSKKIKRHLLLSVSTFLSTLLKDLFFTSASRCQAISFSTFLIFLRVAVVTQCESFQRRKSLGDNPINGSEGNWNSLQK